MFFASDSSVGSAAVLGLLAVFTDVSGYLLPSMTSLRCSSPVTTVTPWTTVCALWKRRPFTGTKCCSGCDHSSRRRTAWEKSWKATGIQRHLLRLLVAILHVSGNLLPSMNSLRCSSPVTMVTPWTAVCACESAPLSQAQTVVQGVTTVEQEKNTSEMSWKVTGIQTHAVLDLLAVFTDVSGYLLPSTTSLRVFFSCYCGHILNNSLCLWKGASFTGHQLPFRVLPR